MEKLYDVMIAGHLCLDIIPLFPDTGIRSLGEILRPGKLVNVGDVKIATGGPVSNTGLNLKKLGFNVCFCSCVGDDQFGRITHDILSKSGNADGIKMLQNQASSYTVVLAPPGIDRIFLHNPGVNDIFCAEDLDVDLIKQSKHFHLGYPPLMKKMYSDEGKELAKIFKIAKECGATTSCDMTLPDPSSPSGQAPWRKILENILPYIDIHVPSIEETFYMLHPEEFLKMKKEHNNAELIDFITPSRYSSIADEVLSMGPKMVTLKSGHRGFYIKTASKNKFKTLGRAVPADYDNWADRELWAPAYTIDKLMSASGSGDSSIAGLLSGYLNGLKIEESLKYATRCGMQNLQALDAVSSIRTWEETTREIKNCDDYIDIHIQDVKGWNWSDKYRVWSGPNDTLTK